MQSSLGFYIGGFFVAYYGLLIILGITAAAIIGWFQIKRFAESYDDFIIIAAMGGLFGIIGAKLLYVLVSIDKIDFSRILDMEYLNSVMAGGFVFYGGLIGGITGLYICKKFMHLNVNSIVSIAVPCLPVVHGFGRIGCSFVGCCYGAPYDGIGAVIYEDSLFAPLNQSLFPIQGTEAVLNFAIAMVLLFVINRYSIRWGLKLYLIMYSVVRFILEFFRYDYNERGLFWGISTSQYISLAIIMAVCFYEVFRKYYDKRLKGGSI